jgi:stage II sporulation protein D
LPIAFCRLLRKKMMSINREYPFSLRLGRCSLNRIIFLAILIFYCTSAYPAHASDDNDPQVVIQVLSKQVRLLREGSLKQFSMLIPKDSTIADELNERSLQGAAIIFKNDNGRIDVYLDSMQVSVPLHLKIYSSSGDGTCTVKLPSEERAYPLPISIQYDSGGLAVYARERLQRYAVDSALAEYGAEYRNDTEAILALSHCIMARYFYMKKGARHASSDFCDLTHCQVYRGRMKGAMSLEDSWLIDHEKLARNLFFHSRCGGRTADPLVFGASPGPRNLGVRDWLYREGVQLCASADSGWERSISRDELFSILSADLKQSDPASLRVEYRRNACRVRVHTDAGTVEYPVETFRLKINRVKGWNCIRSNSMRISETTTDGKHRYIFHGEGLGHGVGLCQHGAVSLSRLGYTRYEILEHYFPDLAWKSNPDKTSYSPHLSYCIFDIQSGKVLAASHGPDFLKRRVPPGSVFKLIVSLYCAEKRPDLFNTHMYDCPGRNTLDRNMPDRCWKIKGHGPVGIQDAIANSCNLYFASLHHRIDKKKFRDFFDAFCRRLDIKAALPEIAGEKQWSELLAGLDFRISFTVADYMRLVKLLYCNEAMDRDGADCRSAVPQQERYRILTALQGTFVSGTASGRLKPAGDPGTYRVLEDWLARKSSDRPAEMWGKTSTVMDGTNRAMSYGLFIGGSGATGIVAVLRKANGHVTAKWAEMVMTRFIAQ